VAGGPGKPTGQQDMADSFVELYGTTYATHLQQTCDHITSPNLCSSLICNQDTIKLCCRRCNGKYEHLLTERTCRPDFVGPWALHPWLRFRGKHPLLQGTERCFSSRLKQYGHMMHGMLCTRHVYSRSTIVAAQRCVPCLCYGHAPRPEPCHIP
jgi:hypothetical protein